MTQAGFAQLLGPWSEGPGPLHRLLSHALQSAIERGELAAGTRLPAERALADLLEVSRTTVVTAYADLRQQGWVDSRRGSGTRVARAPLLTPAPREGAAVVLSSRNLVFRALVQETGAAAVEFLGAHLGGLPDEFALALDAARDDLIELVRGHGYLPLGLPALRKAIAAHLERQGLPTREEQVLVTSGAQQALTLVANLLIERGDAVVLEDPSYLGAIDAFALSGARLTGVPLGPDGVRVDLLREALARTGARLAYLIPSFQNPAGSLMGEAQRREVARLADEAGVVLVEDMTLADLSLGAAAPPPLAAFARSSTVLSIGSLSKLFWGGLRVGWIRGPEPVVARLARMKVVSDLGGSLLSQAVAARLLKRSAELVQLRRRQIRERYTLMTRLLAKHLPAWSWPTPAGGLSLWVRLGAGDAAGFAQVALRHGVAIVPGTVNSPEGRYADHLRLPFVAEPKKIEDGVRRLARAWEEYAPAPRTRSRIGVLV